MSVNESPVNVAQGESKPTTSASSDGISSVNNPETTDQVKPIVGSQDLMLGMMRQLQMVTDQLNRMDARQIALETKVNKTTPIILPPPSVEPKTRQVQFQDVQAVFDSLPVQQPIPSSDVPPSNHLNISPHLNFDPMSPNPQFHNSTLASPPFVSENHLSASGRYDRRTLYRSGLSYSGSPSGITIDMFLFQLETVAKSINLPEESLMFEISTVLKDVALSWYWTYRKLHPRTSWSELRRDFVARFQDRRTNYDIRRSIESRKQQANEGFMDFYHQVWSLTLQSRIPYSDEELIQVLMSNMKPMLQYHLTDKQFTNIDDLIRSCLAWENTLKKYHLHFDPVVSPRRAVNELSVNHYDDIGMSVPFVNTPSTDTFTNSSLSTYRGVPGDPNVSSLQPGNADQNKENSVTQNAMVCFNCSDLGHGFRECNIPPTGLFCYVCGSKGTTASRCRRCSENKNSGPWRSGNQGPQRSTIIPRMPKGEDVATNTDPELARRRFSNNPTQNK